jgi:hypothetical protein
MYKKYRVENFKPYTKELSRKDVSCGGHIACVVTGIPLDDIHKLHPRNDDWSTNWMEGFLSSQGFYLKRIQANFYNKRKGFKPVFFDDHIIVYVLIIDKNESTWALSYKNRIYHGQNAFENLTGFDILANYPVQEMYLCFPKRKCKKQYVER